MNRASLSIKRFIPSLLIIAAGLVLTLAGVAPKFMASASDMVNFPQMYTGILIAVAVAFCFGAVRYNMAVGVSLALISLHDLLLTLALTALLSFALPQAAVMPVMVLFAPVFTFVQSLPVIRAARDLRAANSARDMSNEQVADEATRSTKRLRLGTVVLGLLFIAAGAAGGLKLAAALLPLLAGLLSSLLASCMLTGKVWLCVGTKLSKKRKR